MVGSSSPSVERSARDRLMRSVPMCTIVMLAALILLPSVAFAGQAASGELFFYPCKSCHPVTLDPVTEKPTKKLPNKFEGHEVTLEGHDELGTGDKACLVCHDDPSKDPGKLKLVDGSLIDITGDVAQVCYRCHQDKYKQWKAGAHGKGLPKCSAAGCHDPHTPGYIYAGPQYPFLGVGWQFKVRPEREAFHPLASPAPPTPVTTPGWLLVTTTVGFGAVAGQVVRLIRGRSKR